MLCILDLTNAWQGVLQASRAGMAAAPGNAGAIVLGLWLHGHANLQLGRLEVGAMCASAV